MKITKMFCDRCGKEFTNGRNDQFGNVSLNILTGNWTPAPTMLDKETRRTIKVNLEDLCGDCANEIYNTITLKNNKP
jgi:hypothetical protein